MRYLVTAFGLVAVGVWTGFMIHVTQPDHAVRQKDGEQRVIIERDVSSR